MTINPSANVLVMTTEILRHALYSAASPLLSNCGLVVFDEVHYISDEERGTVWEESLIALLSLYSISVVCLSATISNANDLADWMAGLCNRAVHVIATQVRPVPLLHYFFDGEERSMVLVKDGKRMLKDNMRVLREVEEGRKEKKKTRGGQGMDLFLLLSFCIVRDWTPVIVFSFSRRDCEQLCLAASSLTLTSRHEQQLITSVFDAAMASLSPDDRLLPQISSLYPLLLKGLATHHSGLLPVLKELVEILFGEGLVKLLFATETFAVVS